MWLFVISSIAVIKYLEYKRLLAIDFLDTLRIVVVYLQIWCKALFSEVPVLLKACLASTIGNNTLFKTAEKILKVV